MSPGLRRRLAAIAYLLAALVPLAGCAAPERDAAPPAAEGGGAPAEAPAPLALSPDSLVEAAILRASPDYTRDIVALGGPGARYLEARADLDGDGRDEVFAYLLGSFFCGSGGCTLMLFTDAGDGYRLVNAFPISRLPVIVAPAGGAGWRDLFRLESGGGAPPSYVRHVFDGVKYVERERLPADARPEGVALLDREFTFEDGIPLEPTR